MRTLWSLAASRCSVSQVRASGVISGSPTGGIGFFQVSATDADGSSHTKVLNIKVFGPVATITPFDSEEEAIRFANSTRYGLSSSVWTRDLQRAHRVAAAIDTGTVWINCWLLRDLRVPFGGAKESGVGREGGFDSLDFFTEAKNVCVKL